MFLWLDFAVFWKILVWQGLAICISLCLWHAWLTVRLMHLIKAERLDLLVACTLGNSIMLLWLQSNLGKHPRLFFFKLTTAIRYVEKVKVKEVMKCESPEKAEYRWSAHKGRKILINSAAQSLFTNAVKFLSTTFSSSSPSYLTSPITHHHNWIQLLLGFGISSSS